MKQECNLLSTLFNFCIEEMNKEIRDKNLCEIKDRWNDYINGTLHDI